MRSETVAHLEIGMGLAQEQYRRRWASTSVNPNLYVVISRPPLTDFCRSLQAVVERHVEGCVAARETPGDIYRRRVS